MLVSGKELLSLKTNLIEVFSSKERLVSLFFHVCGKPFCLHPLLPRWAAAVATNGVVQSPVVVHIVSSQDGGPAGAAQRAGGKLSNTSLGKQKKKKGHKN